jgi:hypothetical protein
VRATYEPLLVALAEYLLIEVPGWVAGADNPDHWERGPRGIIARRLVQGLASGAVETDRVATSRGNPAKRLRNRLRSEAPGAGPGTGDGLDRSE